MNTKMFKGVGAAISLFVSLGAASPVLADTSTGAEPLGAAANAIDVWTFTCPPAVGSRGGARASVSDLSPPNRPEARMQVVLGKDSRPTAEVTDLNSSPSDEGGEGGASSDSAVVRDGPGDYAMVFKKTAGVEERYSGQAGCVNAADVLISNPDLTKVIEQ